MCRPLIKHSELILISVSAAEKSSARGSGEERKRVRFHSWNSRLENSSVPFAVLGPSGPSAHPRRPVLYPSASHFLLVDDVHELDRVVALHVNHRPLQGVLCDLVELGRKTSASLKPVGRSETRERQLKELRDDAPGPAFHR